MGKSRRSSRPCSIEGCERTVHGHDFCQKHYMRWRTHGDPLKLLPTYEICTVDGCDLKPRSMRSGLCEKHIMRVYRYGTLEPLDCVDCGAPLPTMSRLTLLCADCRLTRRRRRAVDAEHRRRAKELQGERIDSLAVFERDGWRCGICRKRVSKTKRWPDPFSPSLDHIVPIRHGGRHEWANVQCAHLRCNTSKGARDIGSQLLLFGEVA